MTKPTSSMKARRALVSIRLSNAEQDELRRLARDLEISVSEFVREVLFSDDTACRDLLPEETRRKLLAQVLALLGEAEYSKSLAEIAEAAHAGVPILSPEVSVQIEAACNRIEEIHQLLLRALGLRPENCP